MSKKYSNMSKTLVIVESPAKCKKIEEYLGPGYKCVASFGHLRELSSLKNVDIQNNFEPTYTIIDNAIKKNQIENIRKEIKKANEIVISTDDDREGEAIGWHICKLFNLDINKTKRITFNEITETALQKAIKNPSRINMNIVNAQQARQILDLLVGFQVSPLLWKYISKNSENSLSAGRCQTPALRIIYDNQKEINEAKEKEKYNTIGFFTNKNISFELTPQGKFETKDEVIEFLDGTAEFDHIYTCTKPEIKIKKCPEPFTTSRLQQTASNELHFSPKETMKVCQSLYEGGYITYMRTDSKKYSKEFIDSTKEYIVRTYEEKYVNENINILINNREKNINENENESETQNNLIQEAHEAIRPTTISLKELHDNLDSKEKRMYKLIWENTLESCMASAIFYSITASILALNNLKFVCSSELINFPGWKIVSKKYLNEINPDNKEYHYLQTIKQNQVIYYKKIKSNVTLTNIKSHYTEARLIQLLEEKGIGRPSTFAMLIDKIQERGYVKKEDIKGKQMICVDFELENGEIFEIESKREFGNEKNKLVLQPLGLIVMEFLENNFNNLFDYGYTKQMEDDLDKISQGNKLWYELCRGCNDQISSLINKLNGESKSKLEIKIDENNSYVIGKYGPVVKNTSTVDGKNSTIFNKVIKDIDIHKLENGEYKLEDILDTNHIRSEYNLGKFEDHDVILKKGKFGLYISWDKNSKTLKELGNQPIESITFKDIEKYLYEGSNIIREISDNITIRKSAKGEYIFYKSTKMKKPVFYNFKGFEEDYKICNINILKNWLKETYKIF